MTLGTAEKSILIEIVTKALELATRERRQLKITAKDFSPALQAQRSSFVTLHSAGELRGCIGSVDAARPLIEDVAMNAFSAAVNDARFETLNAEELPGLVVHLTVLSALEDIPCRSEAELLGALHPGIDGLLIRDGGRHATFLPVMWERLPSPEEFLLHLKEKAGMPANHWSKNFRAQRYRAEEELEMVMR